VESADASSSPTRGFASAFDAVHRHSVLTNDLLYLSLFSFNIHHDRFGVRPATAVSAEAASWAPADGSKWEEKDFESELKKLEEEAEKRMDEKIKDMMSKIESTGSN